MFTNKDLALNGGKPFCPDGLKRGKVFGWQEKAAVAAVMDSGLVSRAGWGPRVKDFEHGFAAFHQANQAISTTSGTTALHTAIDALGIGPGDEVIVPDLTFVSTATAALQVGAKVVLCDIDPLTFNISPADLERKINKKTKAVIVVHLYGLPADMKAVVEIAHQAKLFIVEDCCQAHGAKIDDQLIGTFGDLACFSFYQTKNMSCGEGGMILTNDEKLARRCRSLTRHGLIGESLAQYDYDKLGYNYAMTELQAAIGLVQLNRLPDLNAGRCHNADKYRRLLHGLGLQFQTTAAGHVNHCLTALLPKNLARYRDDFLRAVRAEGAQINCLYPISLSWTELFSEQERDNPVALEVAASLFNLYTNPDIKPDFVAGCCGAIRKVMGSVSHLY